MADTPIIINQGPPLIQGQAKVNLRKNDFNAGVWNKGTEVFLEKALRCPCKPMGDQPLSSCLNCGGMGWFFIQKRTTKTLIQGANIKWQYKEWSEENASMISVTALERDNLAIMDRITIRSATSFFTQPVHMHFNTSLQKLVGRTFYQIINITEAFLFVESKQALTRLQLNTDYTFDGNTFILNSKYNTSENITVTLRYKHNPQFHVISMSREFMTQLQQSFTTGNFDRDKFPVSAMAQRAHYCFDQLNYFDLSGDALELIDNSYQPDICADPIEDPAICIDPVPTPTVTSGPSSLNFSPPPTEQLVCWLRADTGINAGSVSDGDAVFEWADQSGNSNNWTQSTAVNQPLFRASSLNGKATVFFDGDTLILNSQLYTSSSYTFYLLVKADATQTGTTNYKTFVMFAVNGYFSQTDGRVGLSYDNPVDPTPSVPTPRFLYDDRQIRLEIGDYDTNANRFTVVSGEIDSVNKKQVYQNGVVGVEQSGLRDASLGSVHFLGGWNNSNGKFELAEMLCYDTTHTQAQIQQVDSYLKNKYGL